MGGHCQYPPKVIRRTYATAGKGAKEETLGGEPWGEELASALSKWRGPLRSLEKFRGGAGLTTAFEGDGQEKPERELVSAAFPFRVKKGGKGTHGLRVCLI